MYNFARWIFYFAVIMTIIAGMTMFAIRAPIVFGILLGIFLIVPVATVAVLYLFGIKIIWWYVAAFLAKYDFIFTNVPESYFKEVVRFGGHRETLLSKDGYKIDAKGDIVPRTEDEQPEVLLPGGLRVVGWPFIDRIYRREMKFLKSLPSGEVKSYDVQDVDEFYAKVDYPYALPFVKCEDKNNLPILGHATLLAHIINPVNSLFATANFYDTMVGLVLPVVRECFEHFTFDEIKEKQDLDELMWEELNNPQPGKLDETKSVIDDLREKYGVGIVALRIVNIDPPEEYRAATLKKWTADREADAARAVAKKEAEETEGRVIEAVARANGMTREDLEAVLRANPEKKGKPASEGGYKDDFAHARDVLKRDRAGDGLEDIRVGNVDGTPLEPGFASIAAMFGLAKSKGSRRSGKSQGGGPSSRKAKNKKKGGKKSEDMTDDELEKDLDESED